MWPCLTFWDWSRPWLPWSPPCCMWSFVFASDLGAATLAFFHWPRLTDSNVFDSIINFYIRYGCPSTGTFHSWLSFHNEIHTFFTTVPTVFMICLWDTHISPSIDQFRYIKIQPKTIDLSTRLMERVCGVYSQKPRIEVYCLRRNLNVSKLVYCTPCFWNRYTALVIDTLNSACVATARLTAMLDRHVNSRRTTTRVASTMESANPVN